MSVETKTRVFSAAIILTILAFIFLSGTFITQIATLVLGALILDEILVHFFQLVRSSIEYLIQLLVYLILVFFISSSQADLLNLSLGLILNSLLVMTLASRRLLKAMNSARYFVGAYIAVFSGVILFLISQPNWIFHLIFLITIGALTDIMAWFWGRRLGRKKLMPSVSPGKTIEGAIGGVVSCAITASFLLFLSGHKIDWLTPILLAAVSSLAVIGDLSQSNLKRKFRLKDSSSLIPGHGGVYDRVDSHFFVAPIYQYLVLIGYITF